MEGSEAHYNFFESLISGRDINSDQSPGENFRRIFPAQVLKDCAMACRIRRGLEDSAEDDKVLVIAGLGHLEYRLGVPERVDQHQILPRDQSAIITVRDVADLPSQDNLQGLGKVDQFEFSYPGDYVLLYEHPPEDPPEVKEEISAAYDRVAGTASLEGDSVTLSKTDGEYNTVLPRGPGPGSEGDGQTRLLRHHDCCGRE